jgi:hypothetical protein
LAKPAARCAHLEPGAGEKRSAKTRAVGHIFLM